MTGGGLRSGQVAAAAGVNVQTLRYYERRGLLQRPDRTTGGHRLYPPDAVVLLRVIKAAQRLGFTLDEVAELLDAGRHRHGQAEAGLQARATAKLAEIDQRIADLHVIRDALADAVEDTVRDLVARESTCCSFFTFAITREPDARVRLDIEVPPQRADVLDGLAERALAAAPRTAG